MRGEAMAAIASVSLLCPLANTGSLKFARHKNNLLRCALLHKRQKTCKQAPLRPASRWLSTTWGPVEALSGAWLRAATPGIRKHGPRHDVRGSLPSNCPLKFMRLRVKVGKKGTACNSVSQGRVFVRQEESCGARMSDGCDSVIQVCNAKWRWRRGGGWRRQLDRGGCFIELTFRMNRVEGESYVLSQVLPVSFLFIAQGCGNSLINL